MERIYGRASRLLSKNPREIFVSITLFIVFTALCLGLSVIASSCSSYSANDESVLEYVYDEQKGGLMVIGIADGAAGCVEIPAEFNGEKVVGVSCEIFTKGSFSEYVFCGDVFFTQTEKLANADLSAKKFYADRNVIDGLRAQLYSCANDEAIRYNALALANGIVPYNLKDDEIYLTFKYDWQSLTASGGNVLPVFIGPIGESFDIAGYAAKFDYIIHRDKTEISHLDWAYYHGNGYILNDITVKGASLFGGITLDKNAEACVQSERVYRIYIHGGNDDNYDLNSVQPDFCFDSLNGERLDFRYVAQSNADGLIGGIRLRRGYDLSWNYAVHNENSDNSVKKLESLSYALEKELSDIDLYPVWTANDFNVKITSDNRDNVITYGDDITFYAAVTLADNGFTFEYEWTHKGAVVGGENALELVCPSLDGAYDGVYTVKVTAFDGENAFSVAYADTILNIEKREVCVDWADGALIYNGGLQTPKAEALGVFGEQLVDNISGGGVNAGNYRAVAVSDCENYILINAEKDFTIDKAPLIVKARDCSVVYGNQPQSNGADFFGFAESDGEEDLSGTLVYSFTLSDFQVGKYANGVCVSGLSSDNYEISYESGSVEIVPRVAELSWEGAEGLIYNGESHYISAAVQNVIDGDDLSVEVIGGTAVNAGNYKASAILTGRDSGNYAIGESGSIEYIIEKADITPEVTVADTEYGSECSPAVSGNSGCGEVVFSYSSSSDFSNVITRFTVGEYYVRASVEETENYKCAVAVSSFKIVPRVVSLKWKNNTQLTYDGAPKNVSATIENALMFDGVSVKVTGGDKIDAGSYTAEAELYGTDAFNYALPQLYTCTYVINKCELTIAAEPKASVYSEELEKLTAKVYGNIYNGEVAYFLRKEEGDDAGIYAIEVVVGQYDNYAITTVGSYYRISKLTPEIDGAKDGVVVLQDCVAYGSDLNLLTDKLPSASVQGKWEWEESGYTTVGEVGQKSFNATFKPTDQKNYNDVQVAVRMQVKKENKFTVGLGSINQSGTFVDSSQPFRLVWNSGAVYIDYVITASWGDFYQGGLTVSVVRKDGTAADAVIDEFTVILNAKGEYLITFECSGNDEYMSGSVTVTVIVE